MKKVQMLCLGSKKSLSSPRPLPRPQRSIPKFRATQLSRCTLAQNVRKRVNPASSCSFQTFQLKNCKHQEDSSSDCLSTQKASPVTTRPPPLQYSSKVFLLGTSLLCYRSFWNNTEAAKQLLLLLQFIEPHPARPNLIESELQNKSFQVFV